MLPVRKQQSVHFLKGGLQPVLLAGEESDPLFSLFPYFRLFKSVPEPFLAIASWALGLSLTLSFRAPQPIRRIPTAGCGSPATRTVLGILSSFGDDVVFFFLSH